MLTIAIISAVVAIIGAGFGILIGLRSKQVFRPALSFNIGLLYMTEMKNEVPKKYKKLIKKSIISTLIYGAKVPPNSEVVFVCPYLLINDSKLPIHNIALQLEYPKKHAIENEVVIKRGEGYERVFGYASIGSESREFQIIGPRAQIRYPIPLLRAGEKVAIGDMMRFSNIKHCGDSNGDIVVGSGLAKRLRKVKKLCDFCFVDVFVYSENCPPISERIKLLWFDTNSPKELAMLVSSSIKAFWGGHMLQPGLYFFPWPWFKLIQEECAEAAISKLKVVKKQDRHFYWEYDLINSYRNMMVLQMPSWNYYQDHPASIVDQIRRSAAYSGPLWASKGIKKKRK